MEDILGLSKPPAPDSSRRVKDWVKEIRALPEEAVVMVSELRCHEDDCPDVETVIAIMGAGGSQKKVKFAKPIDNVTRKDIEAWR
jgi:hypothetical protein